MNTKLNLVLLYRMQKLIVLELRENYLKDLPE